jgi:hypothetical protein
MEHELLCESETRKPASDVAADLPLKEGAWWWPYRRVLGWTAFWLVPVSAVIAFALLHAMGIAGAAATGGCGGG